MIIHLKIRLIDSYVTTFDWLLMKVFLLDIDITLDISSRKQTSRTFILIEEPSDLTND